LARKFPCSMECRRCRRLPVVRSRGKLDRIVGLVWFRRPLASHHYLRYTSRMTESQSLPRNFGGIAEEEFSSFENSRILVWPIAYEGTVSYGTGTGAGAMAIVNASRNMELYDDETDAEVYKVGIHTLPEFTPRETPDTMMSE